MEAQATDAAAPRGAADADHAGGQTSQAIDLAQLAEKVYRLLREELRLDKARGAANGSRGRR
jgi:hypothetical protein